MCVTNHNTPVTPSPIHDRACPSKPAMFPFGFANAVSTIALEVCTFWTSVGFLSVLPAFSANEWVLAFNIMVE